MTIWKYVEKARTSSADSSEEETGGELARREAKLMPAVLARLERITALADEVAGLVQERVGLLAQGSDVGEDAEARIGDLLAEAGRELAELHLHPDRKKGGRKLHVDGTYLLRGEVRGREAQCCEQDGRHHREPPQGDVYWTVRTAFALLRPLRHQQEGPRPPREPHARLDAAPVRAQQ